MAVSVKALMPSLRALFGLRPRRGPGTPVSHDAALPNFAPNSGWQIPLPRPDLPHPDPALCIIGDLHGRADLLDQMLDRIAAQPQSATARIVFVGDLIDHGPDSAAVLRRVHGLCEAAPGRIICLMGNHERMMLDFLAQPEQHAERWFAAGGLETLRSFGLSARVPAGRTAARHFADLGSALHTALQPALLDWVSRLPLFWQTPGLGVVHADARPDLPLSAQPDSALLWGRVKPHTRPRHDGLWLAHGHVIVPQVQITAGRIAVDTGAYRTGRLSALWLSADGAQVIEAR